MACLRTLLLLCLVLLLAPASCRDAGAPAQEPRLSEVTGDAEALRRVLGRLAGWRETPLGRRAEALATRLADCRRFEAQAPPAEPAQLLETLRCAEPSRAAESDADSGADLGRGRITFFVHVSEQVRLAGEAHVDEDGSVRLDGELRGAGEEALLALARPAEQPAGAPRLSGRDGLAHLRLRPAGGLDVASLVPEGGQGDRLFRLKSEIFSGAVLDGALEAALYLPPEDLRMPLAALGVDMRRGELARQAMERFVADLEETWSIQATPFAAGAHRGACLLRLNLMPELAPCYVLTGDQLVIGWNPPSVRHAVGGEPPAALDPAGGLLVHLGRFPEADRRLRQAYAPTHPPARIDYAWEELRLRTRTTQGGVRFALQLTEPPSASALAVRPGS